MTGLSNICNAVAADDLSTQSSRGNELVIPIYSSVCTRFNETMTETLMKMSVSPALENKLNQLNKFRNPKSSYTELCKFW